MTIGEGKARQATGASYISISIPMSSAAAECVMAPTAMRSTPVRAIERTVSSVTPPDASNSDFLPDPQTGDDKAIGHGTHCALAAALAAPEAELTLVRIDPVKSVAAVAPLMRLFPSKDDKVSAPAGVVLREIGPGAKSAIPDLLEMLKDGDRRRLNLLRRGALSPDHCGFLLRRGGVGGIADASHSFV